MACNHSQQYFDAVEDIPGPHRLGNRPAGGHRIVLPKGDRQFRPILEKLGSFNTTTKREPPLKLHFLIYAKYWVQKLLLDRANGLWQDMLVCQPLLISFAMHHLPTIALKVSRWESFRHMPESDSRNMRDSGCSRRPSWRR